MPKFRLHRIFILSFLLLSVLFFSQSKIIKGKIINAQNGEAMAFVPVYIVSSEGIKILPQPILMDFTSFVTRINQIHWL